MNRSQRILADILTLLFKVTIIGLVTLTFISLGMKWAGKIENLKIAGIRIK